MTQLRFNYFTGIKLPWTLASETVWKTHRVGGIGFMIIGIIYIISSFISGSLSFIITMVSLFILMSLQQYIHISNTKRRLITNSNKCSYYNKILRVNKALRIFIIS